MISQPCSLISPRHFQCAGLADFFLQRDGDAEERAPVAAVAAPGEAEPAHPAMQPGCAMGSIYVCIYIYIFNTNIFIHIFMHMYTCINLFDFGWAFMLVSFLIHVFGSFFMVCDSSIRSVFSSMLQLTTTFRMALFKRRKVVFQPRVSQGLSVLLGRRLYEKYKKGLTHYLYWDDWNTIQVSSLQIAWSWSTKNTLVVAPLIPQFLPRTRFFSRRSERTEAAGAHSLLAKGAADVFEADTQWIWRWISKRLGWKFSAVQRTCDAVFFNRDMMDM